MKWKWKRSDLGQSENLDDYPYICYDGERTLIKNERIFKLCTMLSDLFILRQN